VPEGPVKQTTGELSINDEGAIKLKYSQYSGSLPYNGQYSEAAAIIDTVLSVGGSFYGTYDNADVGSKNVQAMIKGFSNLDPSTYAMFPILAVLNTTSNLEETFSQFDPSQFNILAFSEESVAHQLQTVLSNNLWQYQNQYCCACDNSGQRIWLAPFENTIYQKGEHHAELCTYQNTISGGIIGLDFLPCENLLFGGGFAYARTRVKWHEVDARSHINSYGGFVYTAWNYERLWLDGNFDFFYNQVDAHRHLFITSTLPLVDPIDTILHNKNHSMTYLGHLGGSYELCTYAGLDFWPFINFDYTHVRQAHIREHGGGPLDLDVKGKETNLFRSEVGLGVGYCYDECLWIFTKLSYANEARFNGKKSQANFGHTLGSEFSVHGKLPQNNLFCATVLLQSAKLWERARLNVAYHGEFGSRFSSNEISAELSVGF
jgi:uncharacterized protein with beta-barrel porin domain